VKLGDLALVTQLLDAGADVDSPNDDGQTALMLAARVGSLDIATLLVERGADVNARSLAGPDGVDVGVDGNHPGSRSSWSIKVRGVNARARRAAGIGSLQAACAVPAVDD
jgi:ankyrin repeat protein